MKIDSRCLLSVISAILILFSTSLAHAQTLSFESYNATNPMTSQFNHTISLEKQASQYYLNDTQTALAINLAKNSTQFQFAVKGHNYTFDGIFGYSVPSPQSGSRIIARAVDFSLYNGPIGLISNIVGVVTVWENPTLTQIFNVTSNGKGWYGGIGEPSLSEGFTTLCGKSAACYLRGVMIPPELESLCDKSAGCYIGGPGGPSFPLVSRVPEFPFALPILVISLASLLIFYRIKLRV